ncbi:hypothetical protein LAZ67_X003010 [Cordylochernes scorpioides]|uniref:Integrase catalytic domain-containing protein n=1 Tax=Cordylochernes scorpioides TaxID=51811 RepID=A0ABY6LX26_9ARAC|nr:hypothetical protein LAZ67_X003010 [Cordylochernes scorpioides]
MNTSIEPDHYEMQVLIFGATSSPCSAIHVKNENAMQHELVNHELAHTIVNDFYVDDCLTGADSEENCMNFRRELSEVNAAGGFHLCKFNSNSRAVIESIPEELRAKGMKSLNEKSVIPAGNVLGMWWDPTKDIFGFKFGLDKVPPEILEGAVPTKRQACSLVMSVYDPLGLVNHFKIKGIIILERTWIADLLSRSIIRQVEVHTFVDASQEAFSAVTYLRVETRNGNITTTLFGSKARVAPLKKLTIPKLELQGFEATKGTDWRWVPTSENPADIATRFETYISFEPTDMWYTGPEFLKRPEEKWPKEANGKDLGIILATRMLKLEDDSRVSHLSSLNRLVCRAAAVQKAAQFWHKKTFHKGGQLNPPWKIIKYGSTASLSAPKNTGQHRILQANKVPAEQKTSAILPSDHHATELLIQAEHERCARQGSETLLNNLRGSFCAHSRSLSQFIDTRERPDTIYNDNGTNFVGASKELKLAAIEIDFEVMAASGKFGPVKWKFNPPAAPHFGGDWERLIKSVKKCLRATLNEVNPKDTTLLTALMSAENIINSRPLTYVSRDPTEEGSLTPNLCWSLHSEVNRSKQ